MNTKTLRTVGEKKPAAPQGGTPQATLLTRLDRAFTDSNPLRSTGILREPSDEELIEVLLDEAKCCRRRGGANMGDLWRAYCLEFVAHRLGGTKQTRAAR